MPFVYIKLADGVFTPEQKHTMAQAIIDHPQRVCRRHACSRMRVSTNLPHRPLNCSAR
jgi:hypothetical protein